MAKEEFDADFERLIEAQRLERAVVGPSKTNTQMAQAILDDAVAVAAMSIVQLSRGATNEQLRFRAAAYILDRALGESATKGPTGKLWEGLFEDIQMEPTVQKALEAGPTHE